MISAPDDAYANCEQEDPPPAGNEDKSHRWRKWTAELSTLTMMDTEDLENNQKNWV